MQARVVSVTRKFLSVHSLNFGEKLLHLPGSTDNFCIGDRVEINEQGDVQSISKQHERQNLLARRHFQRQKNLCANCDRVFLLCGPGNLLQLEFLDRVICAAVPGGIPVTVVANKIDLSPGYAEELRCYSAIGMEVLSVSAKTGQGMDTLVTHLSALGAELVLFTGVSGVGKSSLLNALFGADLRLTRLVNERHGTGRQTTSQSKAFFHEQLCTYVVDLPGVQQFGLHHLTREQLLEAFPEFFSYTCEFDDCAHIKENDCAIRQAVATGAIPTSRYDSYVKFMTELGRFRHYVDGDRGLPASNK